VSVRKRVLLSTFVIAIVAALGTFTYVAKKGKINVNADTFSNQFTWTMTQHFPSAKYFGYITSGGTTDSYTWEANNTDIFNAGDTASLITHKQVNPDVKQFGYTVLRYANSLSATSLNFLQDYAESHGGNFEDMFVHYAEDTTLVASNNGSNYSVDHFLANVYYNGSTYRDVGDWYSGDSTIAFGGSTSNLFYFGSISKYDEINLELSTVAGGTWNGVFEYWNGSSWTNLTATDGTNNLRQNGQILFIPPNNWQKTTIGGGSSNIKDENMYLIRLKVNQVGTTPSISKIRGANYLPLVDAVNSYYQVPGFDDSADTDHDGYLNLTEYSSHAINKTARFKYWSRVLGRQYVVPVSWNFNHGNALFREAETANVVAQISESHSGFTDDGMFFDDFMPGLNYYLYNGAGNVNPISGGMLDEYSSAKPCGSKTLSTGCSTTVNTTYSDDTIVTLAAIKAAANNEGKVVDGCYVFWPGSIQNSDYCFWEAAYYNQAVYRNIYDTNNSTSFVNGIKNIHDAGIVGLIQGQNGLADKLGNTQAAIERGKYLNLAIFYTMQNPDTDFFRNWLGTTYSSQSNPDYFVETVKADIGRPSGIVPTGYTAIPGVDSNAFIFTQGTDPLTGKTYKVVARDYSKALVLVKPLPDGASTVTASYADDSATDIALPQTDGGYYLVNYDGSISSTPITFISLRNAEGAILIKASALNSMQITKSVNKSSAGSGDEITYTISYSNPTDRTFTTAKIEDNIPSGSTYVSADNNPTVVSGKITWNLGNVSPGASGTVKLIVKVD
jgi:uncharacterized repeat protein (TIGR01451 family)